MAVKKVGTLIREARTAKKLSQEQLASGIDGLSGSDIGKAERGEKNLSQAQLKAIAKALGITQKSLLEAPKGGSSSTASTAKKASSSSKTNSSSAKSSTAAAKKTSSSSSKTGSTQKESAPKTSTAAKASSAQSELSSAEKKLVEAYRTAGSDSRKLAMKILKGERPEIAELLPLIMQNSGNGNSGDEGLLAGLLGKFMK